ncbi:MAG: putative modification/repair radical protein, partial [Firmicutes bacterium]|nr:putative modification/repair radical protein [Bacillota bacterium]
TIDTEPPLWREHRLYQADWLLRFYGFAANELLDEQNQSFNPYVDPKCNWALHHLEFFPMDVNRAPYSDLLRVPGIGVNSAKRIVTARRMTTLNFESLKKLGVVLKRAQYFITCKGKKSESFKITEKAILHSLMSEKTRKEYQMKFSPREAIDQLSLFDMPFKVEPNLLMEDIVKCLQQQM